MRRLVLLALGILLFVAGFLGLRSNDNDSSSPVAAQAAASVIAQVPDLTAHDGPEPEAAPEPSEKQTQVERYHELRKRLQSASLLRRDQPRAAKEGEDPVPSIAPIHRGSLEKEYIQKQMKEVVPLIKECYDIGLEADSSLAGTVVVQFTIIGEPDIGGLVESSEVDLERSDMTNSEFLQCVQESMYALEFDAPEGGGEVTVKMPFNFSNESPTK